MRKIILIFLLLFIVSPVLAYNETYAIPHDKYVYPESLEIYGYVHYSNGTLIPYGSKIVASNDYGVEVGQSYVDESGMYGVESKKIYDENKLSAESKYSYYYAGGYRTLEFNDTLYFWVHTDEMKDKLYLKTNEYTTFLSNEIIFLNLTIPQIENSQLKNPVIDNTVVDSFGGGDISKVINPILITPTTKQTPVVSLNTNTQGDSKHVNEGGVVETSPDLLQILLIFGSLVVISICVIIILMRRGIITYTKGERKKKIKKQRLKFLYKVDNSFDEDLVCLYDYANYMHVEVEPDILVLWKYANFL